MGAYLTPIIVKKTLNLHDLKGRILAVDANNYLYQFLSLIRTRDGTPLMDSHENITSHLAGLLFRSTRLIHDFGIDLVFVFDGKPPALKAEEITSDWSKLIYFDWIPSSGYYVPYQYGVQYYDQRFKGLDKIEESTLDVYVPIEKVE